MKRTIVLISHGKPMRRLVILSTAILCILTIQPCLAQTPPPQFGTAYRASLFGRGYDAYGNYDSALRNWNLDVSVQDAFEKSYSKTTYQANASWTEGPQGQISNWQIYQRERFAATLYLRESYGDLGIELVNSTSWDIGSGTPFRMQSNADIMRWDSLSLFYRGNGIAPNIAGNNLRFNFGLNATIENSGLSGGADFKVATFDNPFTLNGETPIYNFFSDETTRLDPFIGVEATVDSNLQADYNILFGVKVDAMLGTSAARSRNTLKFESVTFEDGTTPESLGFEIVFASGIPSPNLIDPIGPPPVPFTAEIDGGSSATGGVEATIFEVIESGVLTADYLMTDIPRLSDAVPAGALPLIDFGFASEAIQVWDIDFTGTFTGDVMLTMGYDDLNLTVPEEDLFLYHFTGEKWEKLSTITDTTANTMTVTVSSLSPFIPGFELVASVPEPSTALLGAIATAGLLIRRRRQR